MLELTELLNNPHTRNNSHLQKLAGLLSSDEAFTYNSTYITDSQEELNNFKKNIIELPKLLFHYSELLHNKLSKFLDDEDLVWAFKFEVNNAIEIVSDDMYSINVNEKREINVLKHLTNSNLSAFVLSLHLKYSLEDFMDLSYNDSFDFHIHHSFMVNNKREIRNSITQFVNIVKLHLYAE